VSADDKSGARPQPVVLRIKLRYDDVEAMVQRFATNVGKSGLFLPTKSLQPIGSEIKFELRLADDTPALVGLGRVKLAKGPDPHDPRATFGMAIELMRVTPQSRALILRMLEQRRALGLPEVGLPTPEVVDAARRAEAVAAATRDPASGPTAAPSASQVVAPVAPPVAPIETHAGEALLTAPRRTTGPLAIAKVLAVAPLAPEPPRRKRVAVNEIIESASGPVASVAVGVPGLDDDVDVAAALARARSLAGSAPDAELDALAEAAAAPLAISIDAASAELARQLGGSAVRRDRSARWAPPPATRWPGADEADPEVPTEPAKQGESAPDAPAEAEQRAEPAEPEGAEAAQPPAPEPPVAPDPPPPDDEDAEPLPLPEVVHRLDALDMEDVEHTERGDIAALAGFDPRAIVGEASGADQAQLGERLDAQLAEAEAEADAENVELARALGLAAYGDPVAAYEHRAELVRAESAVDVDLDEIDDFEILAETDANDEHLAAHGEDDDGGDSIVQQPTGVRRPSALDFAARLDLGDDSDLYYAPPGEFSAYDAIDRLHEEFSDRHAHDGLHGAYPDEPLPSHLDSAGHALAAFEGDDAFDEPETRARDPGSVVAPIFDADSSSSFTLAGVPSDSLDLEIPAAEPPPVEPPRRTKPQTGPMRKQPNTLRNSPFLPSLLDSPVEDHELESALEALDVDLDDLAIPHAATELQRDHDPNRARPVQTIRPASHSLAPQHARSTQPAAPAGRTGAPRVTTEDGVIIDFDDDE